jgi:hypothetical protein
METEAQGGCATKEHDAALCLYVKKHLIYECKKHLSDAVEPNGADQCTREELDMDRMCDED